MSVRLLALLLLLPFSANAAISFVATSNDGSGNDTTATPAEPTGTAQNDLVIAFCVHDTAGGTWTDPADFTPIDELDITSTAARLYIGYKIRGATTGSGYTFTHSDAGDSIGCTLTSWRGVDTSNPFDVTYARGSHFVQGLGELDPAAPITTVTDGAEVVLFYHEQSDTSVTDGPPSGYTSRSFTIGGGRQIVIASKNVSSAGTETPGSWTFPDLATTAAMAQFTLAIRPLAAPSFSAGPAVGTLTSTTAQITATPSQSATWYGIACADGETADASQVKAGTTCSGGAAADAFSKAVAGADSQTFTGLSESTAYDTFHVLSNGNGDSSVATLADVTTQAAAAPSFTAGPTVSAAANGYTIAGTISCTGTCTVYAVACALGDAAPTADEIETGDCGGGNDAILAASEEWATTVGDSFSLAAANKPARLNVYVSGSNGSDDTSVVPFLGKDRSPRSGYAIVGMSSHSDSGICGLDSYFDPDCADGSVIEYETTRNSHSNCGINIAATGLVSYWDKTDGQDTGPGESGDSSDDSIDDCAGQISFELSYEYGGSSTDGLFTAPSVGNFSTDDTAYINNTAPVCDPESDQVVLTKDEAMTQIDLEVFGGCSDDDGDALSYSVSSGTLPNGTSLGGTGDREWSGTPDTEDEDGESITITVTDTPGDTATFNFTAYVLEPITSWRVPDCVGLTVGQCEDEILEVAPWRVDDTGLSVDEFVCGTGQPFLSIAEQSPQGGDTAEPFDPISVNIVGAVIPDLTGMTAADAIAAIEALCP